ncbi:YchJ family protein [Shewanella goraebulensis]|uniref:YchJ family protein n=1 Tax=Shewanella goraebulensis TaxID=3050637 RepID=UPI00254EBE28|nr:YchJ family protein [Shewanella goraebulensis]
MKIEVQSPCPCGLAKQYQYCCQPYHLKIQSADNVESLMRSRYCAFALQQFEYLIETHHPQFLNGLTINLLAQGADDTQWLGLDVEQTTENYNAQTGTVTFKAWYLNGGEIDAIYECSQFQYLDGKWYYTNGTQKVAQLPKRNDKCICHSGKKFKACCMKKMA